MRTRLFLRTAEFLWQEGHTAHATAEEAIEETERMLGVYAEFAEKWMAMPVLRGLKTPNERFAGAVETYCIEGLMQDGKALQCGTSHFLGQNFAKSFDVKFVNKESMQEYAWATSWGVSTRLMGALIMAHSDDNGLVLPPKLAPIQVVIVPIYKTWKTWRRLNDEVEPIIEELKSAGISRQIRRRRQISARLEICRIRTARRARAARARDARSGKRHGRGRPPRHADQRKYAARRDGGNDRRPARPDPGKYLQKGSEVPRGKYFPVDTWDDFKEQIEKGGFITAHWDGTAETEEKIKDETKATIRCIPLDAPEEDGVCVYSGKPSTKRVIFARAY